MVENNVMCPLCGGKSKLRYTGHPGYVYGKTYDVFACDGCNASFVYPLTVEKRDYDEIYGDAENLSGYDKYYALSQKILSSDKPLDVMTLLGNEYAFVIGRIRRLLPPGARVLEVGCGFGYLTYSLNRGGYRAVGVDVSEISIERATTTYGPYYQCIGFNDFSSLEGERFDCIVLTEVIEHVTDPVAFLKSLASLLSSGGMILLTTPNKSAFPAGALWMTDAPPIHLWWFSEASVSVMASRASLASKLYRGHVSDTPSYHYWEKTDNIEAPLFVPEFDKEGRLLRNDQEYRLDIPVTPLMRRLYARFVPMAVDSLLIKLKNRVASVRKTDRNCTMFVELKKTRE